MQCFSKFSPESIKNEYYTDLLTHLKDDIVKMSIYQKDHAEETVNAWFTPKWRNQFKIASAGTMWMDIVEPDADKGSSLRDLQVYLGVTPEETMVFGDNLNDMGMLADNDINNNKE